MPVAQGQVDHIRSFFCRRNHGADCEFPTRIGMPVKGPLTELPDFAVYKTQPDQRTRGKHFYRPAIQVEQMPLRVSTALPPAKQNQETKPQKNQAYEMALQFHLLVAMTKMEGTNSTPPREQERFPFLTNFANDPHSSGYS